MLPLRSGIQISETGLVPLSDGSHGNGIGQVWILLTHTFKTLDLITEVSYKQGLPSNEMLQSPRHICN